MEKLDEGFYQAKNLSGKDAKLLATISSESIASITKTLAAVQDLAKNLQIYKDCLIDSINLEAESADIASKYADTSRMNGQQPYILPGVVTTPKKYDINAIKADSDRMMEIQQDRQKAAGQKETYLRLCKEDVRVFLAGWKRTNYDAVLMNEFIDDLNNNINPAY